MRSSDQQGFTLIEILMVLLLVAILAAVAITQFSNYTPEAKNSALKSDLQVIRQGIATQFSQERLRCGVTTNAYPPLDTLVANDITGGATPPCTAAQVTMSTDRRFTASGMPPNPWGPNQAITVVACSGTGCTNKVTYNCAGTARAATDDGWCYNVTTGDFWANSARNDGNNSTTGNEYTY
jgi:prepilin-type N-terminal cleavage/methylation domain-containing protein